MIQPIRNQVLVKPFNAENVSEGGIFIPETVKKESNKVLIVAVGKGSPKNEMKLKADTIGYRVKEWGIPIEENNELYYLMDEAAILAID